VQGLDKDFALVIAGVIGVAALGEGVLLRGPLRIVVFVAGLLIAAMVAGLVRVPSLW
jgi:hypothetical protein